ncbi:MAG: MFS transporter [Halieaceae bacterium]|jgi:MFS family permease|nr:MFS transporter [Halieaceae bacterium]
MRVIIGALLPLLVSAGILYTGNNLQNTLLAVRGNSEGFNVTLIGALLSAYFVGFIVGCRYAPRPIAAVGHIRAFSAFASIASAAALGHAVFVEPKVWLVLRVIVGFCMAGIAMIIESWLNEMASNENRGRVLSVYRLVDLGSAALGQALLVVAHPSSFVLFSLISVLISLALVPIALADRATPAKIHTAKLDVAGLLVRAPLAAYGALLIAAAVTAFFALAPVYIQEIGYSSDVVALFMSSAIIGAALSQWPLGLLSDRIDRTRVIVVAALLAALGATALLVASERPLWALLLMAAGYGAFAFTVFGICIAHANDFAEPGSYIETNASLFLLYGVGAVVGPIAASSLMGQFGPGALFIFMAVIFALLALIGFTQRQREAEADLAPDDKDSYVALAGVGAIPVGTPESLELDPRMHDESVADDEETVSAAD